MGRFSAGQVIFVPFPYSDLTAAKTRPVLLLAEAGHDDWVTCQITSNPYADQFAIALTNASFRHGGLHHVSYARPSKLFTAHESLAIREVGLLHFDVLAGIREAAARVIRS